MKLSQSALDQMKDFGNTNKCESVNRVISTCLPKNKTFSRNATGRTAAAVLKVNNKTEVALAKTLQAVGCPVGLNSRSHQELKNIRKRRVYSKAYKKRVPTILTRYEARKEQACEFVKHKQLKKKCIKDGYKKHKLEPTLSIEHRASDDSQPGCSSW